MPKSNVALTLAPLHETVSIHTRWSEGVNARFPGLIRELIELGADLILSIRGGHN
jgi:hypothetical protein